MPEESFHFQLSPDEQRRLRKFAGTAGLPRWYLALITVNLGCQFTMFAFGRSHALFLASVALAASGVCMTGLLIAIVMSRRRKLVVAGSLTLTESGFSGTLDGKLATISWSNISSVRDVEDAIVITRTHGRAAIAIPTSAIADSAAFWTTFEEKLIGKRDLILPRNPLRQITNTAFPVGSA